MCRCLSPSASASTRVEGGPLTPLGRIGWPIRTTPQAGGCFVAALGLDGEPRWPDVPRAAARRSAFKRRLSLLLGSLSPNFAF